MSFLVSEYRLRTVVLFFWIMGQCYDRVSWRVVNGEFFFPGGQLSFLARGFSAIGLDISVQSIHYP